MADALEILFGSAARVKLLRFFLFNPEQEFTFEDISRRARLVRRTARTEINALERAGVIKKKNRRSKEAVYTLNSSFPQLPSLQTFFFETAPITGKTLLRHLRKAGALDFVAAAGMFVREPEQRLDVLLAMKNLNESKVESAIRGVEAELGIEIRFAALETEEFLYRVQMYDKLTRDVFDYKHLILVDKISVKDELTQKSSFSG